MRRRGGKGMMMRRRGVRGMKRRRRGGLGDDDGEEGGVQRNNPRNCCKEETIEGGLFRLSASALVETN